MPNSQLHTAISQARYLRYFIACGNRKIKALKLYRANIRLSQQFYGVISVFEIILRNSIDRHMISAKGDTWLEDAVQPGGYLEVTPGCEDSFHYVQEAIHKLGKEYTHDRLISKLTLGFWANQFAAKQFAASGSTLMAIFPKRPVGTRQKIIYENLIKINDFRNRIAHHEPICFDAASVSTIRASNRYSLILELLNWLGCDPTQILYGIDKVNTEIAKINNL